MSDTERLRVETMVDLREIAGSLERDAGRAERGEIHGDGDVSIRPNTARWIARHLRDAASEWERWHAVADAYEAHHEKLHPDCDIGRPPEPPGVRSHMYELMEDNKMTDERMDNVALANYFHGMVQGLNIALGRDLVSAVDTKTFNIERQDGTVVGRVLREVVRGTEDLREYVEVIARHLPAESR